MKYCIPIICVLVLCLFACDQRRVFEKNMEIPRAAWSASDTIRFEVQIHDTASSYNLYVNIRNTTDYAYRNLWLFVTVQGPNGKQLKDTVECPLADDLGRWYGRGVGSILDNRILFKREVRFTHKGLYTFALEQAMRAQPLENILDVGLRIERAK